MSSMDSPVGMPDGMKQGIFRLLDAVAANPRGQRLLTKFAAVAQTSLGAGNHDYEGSRTGENRLLAAASAVLPNPCALDIGANHGSWGLELLARNPRSRVVFVEPRDRAAREIERRIAGNPHAIVIQVAVGETNGEAELFGVDGLGDQASLRIDLMERTPTLSPRTTTESEMVQLRRVAVVAQEAVDRGLTALVSDFSMAKVDIEGLEFEAVTQLMTDLAHHMMVVQFEFHVYALAQGHTIDDFDKTIGSDFELFRLAPRMMIPYRSLPNDAANYFGFSNWVAVHRSIARDVEREYRQARSKMLRSREWVY